MACAEDRMKRASKLFGFNTSNTSLYCRGIEGMSSRCTIVGAMGRIAHRLKAKEVVG
jgi:hypothetical protein